MGFPGELAALEELRRFGASHGDGESKPMWMTCGRRAKLARLVWDPSRQ